MKLFAEEYKTPTSASALDKKYRKGKISFEEWEHGLLVHTFHTMYSFKWLREHDQRRVKEQLDEYVKNGGKTNLQLSLKTWEDPKASDQEKYDALYGIKTYKILNEMDDGRYYNATLILDGYIPFAASNIDALQKEYRNKFGWSDDSYLYGRPLMKIIKEESIQREGIYAHYKQVDKDKRVAAEKTRKAKLLSPGEVHTLICVYIQLFLESARRYAKEHSIERLGDVLFNLDLFQELDCFTEDMLFVKPDGELAEPDIHLFDRMNAEYDLSAIPNPEEFKKMRGLE